MAATDQGNGPALDRMTRQLERRDDEERGVKVAAYTRRGVRLTSVRLMDDALALHVTPDWGSAAVTITNAPAVGEEMGSQ